MTRLQIGVVSLIIGLCAVGCVDSSDVGDIEVGQTSRSIALPLINSSVQITDFEQESETTNVSVTSDDEGKVTVTYVGTVVSRDWSVISPALPYVPFNFQDSITDVEILNFSGAPLLQDEVINKLEFLEWNIKFQINHSYTEPITVEVEMPQISNSEGTWKGTFTVPYDGQPVEGYLTEDFDLEGYTYATTNNVFQMFYDARLPDGTRVEFDESVGAFVPFNTSYIEGYLGHDTFDVIGSIVPVDLFTTWKSGGVDFENPTIDIFTENSLGLPMAADMDEFSITTIDGETFDVEAEAIDNGIALNYPLLHERGQSKTTDFSFTKDNSNVKELFKERLERVNYDINAVYNPDRTEEQNQFIGEGGFFSANVSVVIPLEGNINDLVLVDTFDLDLDLGTYDEVEKATLKTLITNQFPLDLEMQFYFLDEDGAILDVLYEDRNSVVGAEVDANGIALPPTSQASFVEISNSRWKDLRATKRVAIDLKLNSSSLADSPLWVYDNYDVLIQMGAVLDVNIE